MNSRSEKRVPRTGEVQGRRGQFALLIRAVELGEEVFGETVRETLKISEAF